MLSVCGVPERSHQLPLEAEHVWFWTVDDVMDPTGRLLDTEVAPLSLRHEVIFRDDGGVFARNDHVTVLILLIEVFVGILDLTDRDRHLVAVVVVVVVVNANNLL